MLRPNSVFFIEFLLDTTPKMHVSFYVGSMYMHDNVLNSVATVVIADDQYPNIWTIGYSRHGDETKHGKTKQNPTHEMTTQIKLTSPLNLKDTKSFLNYHYFYTLYVSESYFLNNKKRAWSCLTSNLRGRLVTTNGGGYFEHGGDGLS